jgi:hypothetical protein
MFTFLKNKSFFKELILSFLAGIYILYSFFSILTLYGVRSNIYIIVMNIYS